MKSLLRLYGRALVSVAMFVLNQPSTSAQGLPVPVVTIRATDPIAKESGDPATFEVVRQGPTNSTLNVYYEIGGTASNGVDYATISHFALIPAGVRSTPIVINPLEDTNVEGTETVVLQLAPSPLMNPLNPQNLVNYIIGSPSNAIAYIFDDDSGSNLPPVVNIFSPPDGAVFSGPTNIQLFAKALDGDGSVTNVEFFAGNTDLGKGLPVVLDPPGVGGVVGLVYFLNWQNVQPGDYSLTAVAADDQGASTTSDDVNIKVLSSNTTNIPPVARISSPANGSTFFAPIDLPLSAFAKDQDGFVVSVEFFDGTNDLGAGQRIACPGPGCLACNICPSNNFTLIWSNAPIGLHVLTAQATDNNGASGTSAPVNVAILPSPPPPTNRPPIVSVIAREPIAIEGTNCWTWTGSTNPSVTWSNWGVAPWRLFTNCGPKNALFDVRRFGATNDTLNVTYALGGTATNGVDYVTLPGFVTIPAGERHALIPLIPIDDGPPDINKTVVLKLTPSTNVPVDYVIGFPPRAAAIIIDSDGPRPITGMLPENCFHVSTAGPNGAWFHVEYSTDLIHWTPVCTNQVVDGNIDFIDPDATSDVHRFYRTVPEAAGPGQ